jgi:hypothetical protein
MTSALEPPLALLVAGHAATSALLRFLESRSRAAQLQFCMQAVAFENMYAPLDSRSGDADDTRGGNEDDADADAGCGRAQGEEQRAVAVDLAGKLFATYLDSAGRHALGMPESIVSSVAAELHSTSGPRRECFRTAVEHVERELERELWGAFLTSAELAEYQMSVLMSGELTLLDVLLCDPALSYFREFGERSNCQVMIEFWLTVHSWVANLQHSRRDSDEEERLRIAAVNQSDAMAIYDRFISMQATQPLVVSHEDRIHVECNICLEDGPSPSSFSKLQVSVPESREGGQGGWQRQLLADDAARGSS